MTTENHKSTTLQTITSIFMIVTSAFICLQGCWQIRDAKAVHETALSVLREVKDKDKLVAVANLNAINQGYTEALMYFSVAAGILLLAGLLPRLSTFNISTNGVSGTLSQIKEELAQIKARQMVQLKD